MKTIIAVLMCITLCGSIYADTAPKQVYLKVNLGLLDVEADFGLEHADVYTEGEYIEDIGEFVPAGGIVEANGAVDGDFDGTGFLLELGAGTETVKSLFIEGSLLYGQADLDTSELNYTDTYILKDASTGVEIDRLTDSGVWPAETETDISLFAGMVDANYAFTDLFIPDSPFSAFAGLGLGFSYNMLDDIIINDMGDKITVDGDSSISFAWRINIGAAYAINEQWSATLTYQYMDLGTAEADTTGTDEDGAFTLPSEPEFDITAHVFSVGATYKF